MLHIVSYTYLHYEQHVYASTQGVVLVSITSKLFLDGNENGSSAIITVRIIMLASLSLGDTQLRVAFSSHLPFQVRKVRLLDQWY